MEQSLSECSHFVSVGEYTRQFRRRKRWGLQDLARATELSASHLSRIENDRAVPNAQTVLKLAKALDGDLGRMLELAGYLPALDGDLEEILSRLSWQ